MDEEEQEVVVVKKKKGTRGTKGKEREIIRPCLELGAKEGAR